MSHELLRRALSRMEAKDGEHNSRRISFASYCPFGNLSAATLLHREALRVCVEAERDNQGGVDEHLIDLIVFGMLMWDLNRRPNRNLTNGQSVSNNVNIKDGKEG